MINWDVDKNLNTILIILIGFVLIFLTWHSISSSGENKRLKKDVHNKLKNIQELEFKKTAIFKSIKRDSLLIIEKDFIISKLKYSEDSLIKELKKINRENTKIRFNYLNSDINKRIKLFSKLATSTD